MVLLNPKIVPDNDHLRFYRGRSMRGTFRPGDCVRMKSVILSELRSGDVVIFRRLKHQELTGGNCQVGDGSQTSELHVMEEAQTEDELVHRVIAIQSDGLVTRGDNNAYADAALVTADNLIGQVTYLERGKKLHPVHGGWVGLWRIRLLRTWKFYLWKHIARIGSVPYHWLNSSGWVARIWHPSFVKLQLLYEGGTLVKYIYRGRVIARWWPQRVRFDCQKPYDLVLHCPELPRDSHK